jgi:hypothetical protein
MSNFAFYRLDLIRYGRSRVGASVGIETRNGGDLFRTH